MRRILLSSFRVLQLHQLKLMECCTSSNIPGVVEDVSEIILNIKELRMKLFSDQPKTLYIDYEGEGEIKASDIKADSDVEILNPDLHIAL